MNFEITKIEALSGRKVSIYTILPEGKTTTLFEDFLIENSVTYKKEVEDILYRIKIMADKEGAREGYFKINEGKLEDSVCALYDKPGSKIRLYCIRLGNTAVILGGGGPKSKSIRSWQQDPALSKSVKQLIEVHDKIYQRILNKDIKWAPNNKDLIGDLDFNENE
ncbi:hypothetical protein DBR43_09550 [Pedobacter sp. KBW06]|uniref:hypothetical protein n=1 Tax=Pedobacter sp. KBW06 TaxID=2153359 RepID=UPI000F59F81C|nr:hypothetical protein [Pedobacter sp. KBW06]RQO75572.1 hypothetical protein DBR43_09550 [Pedobacter sp. KBW06]